MDFCTSGRRGAAPGNGQQGESAYAVHEVGGVEATDPVDVDHTIKPSIERPGACHALVAPSDLSAPGIRPTAVSQCIPARMVVRRYHCA